VATSVTSSGPYAGWKRVDAYKASIGECQHVRSKHDRIRIVPAIVRQASPMAGTASRESKSEAVRRLLCIHPWLERVWTECGAGFPRSHGGPSCERTKINAASGISIHVGRVVECLNDSLREAYLFRRRDVHAR
jgi:hypothetical protein